jgi:hypothetical protein
MLTAGEDPVRRWVRTWGYNKGLDRPLLGGSQVSKARPGAPFACFRRREVTDRFAGLRQQIDHQPIEWFPTWMGHRPIRWSPIRDRSPTNRMVSDLDGSPTDSLVPDGDRSPTNRMVSDLDGSPTDSLVPDGDRSPAHRMVSDLDGSPIRVPATTQLPGGVGGGGAGSTGGASAPIPTPTLPGYCCGAGYCSGDASDG